MPSHCITLLTTYLFTFRDDRKSLKKMTGFSDNYYELILNLIFAITNERQRQRGGQKYKKKKTMDVEMCFNL